MNIIDINPEEKNESLLKFPCDFPLKIIGKATDSFTLDIMTILKKYVPELHEDMITIRTSKENTYCAITATIYVENKETLDMIYQELSQHHLVTMVL